MNESQLNIIEEHIKNVLSPEIATIIDSISKPRNDGPFLRIPVPEDADLSVEQLAQLVIKASNAYAEACRLAGMARAGLKLADRRYKVKLKTSRKTGRNSEEREAAAMEASLEEYRALSVIEAIVEMADAAVSSARVASETARKLLDKAQSAKIGEGRAEYGYSKSSGW